MGAIVRTPVIAGNWKMHKTPTQAARLAEVVVREVSSTDGVEVVVCPPFAALGAVARVIAGSRIGLGAQNLHWEKEGAYTGEISAEMLGDVGCRYVIVGHSERRQYFGETDESVNRKCAAALASGLTPIVCVGETLLERDAGRAYDVVAAQTQGALVGFAAAQVRGLIFAYEPVWAIGTGRSATPSQAGEMHAELRAILGRLYGDGVARDARILYGGSVNADNAGELLSQPEIDGALVGGASLQAGSFASIAKAARKS
jgi:triosephosphate isomerase